MRIDKLFLLYCSCEDFPPTEEISLWRSLGHKNALLFWFGPNEADDLAAEKGKAKLSLL